MVSQADLCEDARSGTAYTHLYGSTSAPHDPRAKEDRTGFGAGPDDPPGSAGSCRAEGLRLEGGPRNPRLVAGGCTPAAGCPHVPARSDTPCPPLPRAGLLAVPPGRERPREGRAQCGRAPPRWEGRSAKRSRPVGPRGHERVAAVRPGSCVWWSVEGPLMTGTRVRGAEDCPSHPGDSFLPSSEGPTRPGIVRPSRRPDPHGAAAVGMEGAGTCSQAGSAGRRLRRGGSTGGPRPWRFRGWRWPWQPTSHRRPFPPPSDRS